MKTGLKLFEEVFASEIEENEDFALSEIEYADGVTCHDENLEENEGWYNYYKVTFSYNGNKYSFEYSSHTSDNVSDTDYDYSSFQLVVADESNKIEVAIDKLISKIENQSVDTMEELVEDLEDIKRLAK